LLSTFQLALMFQGHQFPFFDCNCINNGWDMLLDTTMGDSSVWTINGKVGRRAQGGATTTSERDNNKSTVRGMSKAISEEAHESSSSVERRHQSKTFSLSATNEKGNSNNKKSRVDSMKTTPSKQTLQPPTTLDVTPGEFSTFN